MRSHESSIFWVLLSITLGLTLVLYSILKQETKDVESAGTSLYDTTHLEQWCRGDEQGTVRMVGAWVYNHEDNTYVLEDEAGNLWVVRDVQLNDDDFLLLWLNNNATPDYLEDDYIVKTWREAR